MLLSHSIDPFSLKYLDQSCPYTNFTVIFLRKHQSLSNWPNKKNTNILGHFDVSNMHHTYK